MDETEAKGEVDTLINNSRFRCFRPIRVAEILYKSRTDSQIDIQDIESYRVKSGNWRDEMSVRLTGKASSSSRSYQKDFSNLIDPSALEELDRINRRSDGVVESYIYHRLKRDKWDGLISAHEYVHARDVDDFSYQKFMSFAKESGLEEDTLLEIATFSLFNGITRELDAKAKLEIEKPDEELLGQFDEFVETFLGLEPGQFTFETPVSIYRAGKGTYAADKGIDIGTNFGTMVQVKHVSLTKNTAKDIESGAYVDRVVVVCRDSEADVIRNVSNQLGYERLHAVVTMNDLNRWFSLAFDRYPDRVGSKVLTSLVREFTEEHTTGESKIPTAVDAVIEERGYDQLSHTGTWAL